VSVSLRRKVREFKVGSNARWSAPSNEIGILRGASAENLRRRQKQSRKRHVVAVRIAGVIHSVAFKKPYGVIFTGPMVKAAFRPSFTGGSTGNTRNGAIAATTAGAAGFDSFGAGAGAA
jgi:hypothetical protein